jgi:hypothetical protein
VTRRDDLTGVFCRQFLHCLGRAFGVPDEPVNNTANNAVRNTTSAEEWELDLGLENLPKGKQAAIQVVASFSTSFPTWPAYID